MNSEGRAARLSREELAQFVFRRQALSDFAEAFWRKPQIDYDSRGDILWVGTGSPREAASFDLPHGIVMRATADGAIESFEVYAFQRLFLEEFPELRAYWKVYRRAASRTWRRAGIVANVRLFFEELIHRIQDAFETPRQGRLVQP